MLTRHDTVILQCLQIRIHYDVHLTLMSYVSYTSIKKWGHNLPPGLAVGMGRARQVNVPRATVTRQALPAHLLATWEKSIKAAPNLLPFLLPDDQGMGPGRTPAPVEQPPGRGPGESLGQYRHLVAAWVHHGRNGSRSSVRTHHILHPWLGPRGSGESPMRAAGRGQASTVNPNGQHRRRGRLGESMSAFRPVAQGQIPGWGDGEPGIKGWEREALCQVDGERFQEKRTGQG